VQVGALGQGSSVLSVKSNWIDPIGFRRGMKRTRGDFMKIVWAGTLLGVPMQMTIDADVLKTYRTDCVHPELIPNGYQGYVYPGVIVELAMERDALKAEVERLKAQLKSERSFSVADCIDL
jgi:predicted DNA-binding transcriptional regulator